MKRYVPFRIGNISFLMNYRSIAYVIGLVLLTIILIILSLGIGQLKVSPLEVVRAVFDSSSDMNNLVVQSFRMPRVLMALFAGAGLAVSGAILQGMIRNPLASPDIIGITGGAAFATVGFLAFSVIGAIH